MDGVIDSLPFTITEMLAGGIDPCQNVSKFIDDA